MTVPTVEGGEIVEPITWGNIVAADVNATTDGLAALDSDVSTLSADLDLVEETLDEIQSGSITGTTDASGFLFVTFPIPYSSTPTVIASRESTVSSAPRICHVHSVSTTGATFRCFAGTTLQASSSGNTVCWVALP